MTPRTGAVTSVAPKAVCIGRCRKTAIHNVGNLRLRKRLTGEFGEVRQVPSVRCSFESPIGFRKTLTHGFKHVRPRFESFRTDTRTEPRDKLRIGPDRRTKSLGSLGENPRVPQRRHAPYGPPRKREDNRPS